MAGSGRMTRRRRVAGKGRIAGRGRLAAPLLGGVGGWVYFHKTTYRGITARRIHRKGNPQEVAGLRKSNNTMR